MRRSGLLAIGVTAVAALAALPAPAQNFRSSAGDILIETVARGLDHPWGLAFLPDGRLLVTERPGRLRIVTKHGALSPPLAGVPKVVAGGQGGLLDIRLDRDFASNRTLYLCYTVAAGGVAALARARLADDRGLDEVKQIFVQSGPDGGTNFGCRIVQDTAGLLYVSLGDHGERRDEAQNLANHIGKIVRIRPDGGVPDDNPFIGRAGAKPEIWASGVRNPQGLAFHPATGRLWEVEHGPRGGDEINIIDKGRNYGWPVIGFGIDYSGARIHAATRQPGMEQPLWYWVPSIAPSGLAFYQGELFPAWRGHLFVGALAGQILVRLELDGDKVVREERLLQGLNERIRDVRAGPDGALWLLTDSSSGRLLRLVPTNR